MRRRIGIFLEYFMALVVIILLLLAIAGVLVVKFHGDELQAYFMEEVNERLDTKVDVEEVSVKIFHKFPNTSIVLDNVVVWSSHNFSLSHFEGSGADTLATARQVSVSFNLLGMIRKKFDLRQVEFREGSLNLLTDTRGEGNYRMIKKKEDPKKGGSPLNISQLKIEGFRIRVDNQAKDLKGSGSLESLDLNGKFSKANSQIRGSLKGSLHEISNNGILYASGNDITSRIQLDVKDSVYILNSAQLEIDRITADVDGRIRQAAEGGLDLDLVAAARNLEIHEVLDLLPKEFGASIQSIRGNGNLQVYTRITGTASAVRTPLIEAEFQTANANLFWERLPFALKNLNLEGSYSNGGAFSPLTTTLSVSTLSTVIGKDHLTGRGEIRNFVDPVFSFELKGEVHPDQWLNWYDTIPLHSAEGTIISDVNVKGSYERGQPKGERFKSLDISGAVGLEDMTLRITPEILPFEDLNGMVHIKNDFWEPVFSGTFGSSDFSLEGTGLNLLSFLFGKRQELIASARFRSSFLDLEEVLGQIPANEKGERSVRFPDMLDLRLEFAISDFAKDLLKAENVRGVAHYESPFFHVDSLTMQTMEGTLRGSFGMVQGTEGGIFSSVDANLYTMDISQVFETFHDFGQQELTHEHLKGIISGNVVFSAEFDPNFQILPATILSENDVVIRNGELNGFKPIMALSRFIEIEELENIRFETLENNILVRNSEVIIPAMDIRSNALDLSASGIHNFNATYEYRLTLKLSDLLYSKARGGSRKSEFDVAEDASDTRTLFLKVTDQGEGAKVELDREQAAKKISEDLKQERRELKQILNEELGLFKRDSSLRKEETKEASEEMFRFDFSEEEEEDSSATEEKPRRRRDRRKRVKNDSTENKEVADFVIDE